jgi:hypothetical protein
MGSCKMSQHRSIVVRLADVKATPKTFRNIAEEKQIDVEDFTGKGKIKDDEDLEARGIASVKYRDIPLHCDDNKEARLEEIGWKGTKSAADHILHPNLDDCERYFEYEQDGTIKPNSKLSPAETKKAKNSIDVFNLDNLHLRKARVDAYKRADFLLRGSQSMGVPIEDICDGIYDTGDDGKLVAYCFVTAYAIKKFI